MKKMLSAVLLMTATMLFAQQPVITFMQTEHDFGKINEADGRVSTVFEFKNEGMEPLVLTNVRASCGCTTPTWTKTPIEPGQTGSITVTYNPNGRPGRFQKTITVTSNASEPTKKLFIKGEVIPKAAKPVNKYPVKMGALSVASSSLNFGVVMKGSKSDKVIEYANLGEEVVTVDVLRQESDPIIAQVSLPSVNKGESGQITVRFDAEAGKIYGPQTYKLYVVVNGKKELTDEYKIELTANVEEDFSQLTEEQRMTAPIIEAEKKIDLGEIIPGKKVKKTISIHNAGADPLYIRAIVNRSTDFFRAVAPKGAIKSGKKANITIELDGKKDGNALKAGEYHRTITVISNDPKNPKQTIDLTWRVKE